MPNKRRRGKQGSRSSTPASTSTIESAHGPETRPPRLVTNNNSNNNGNNNSTKEPPLVLTSDKRRGSYECDYCHSDISQVPRISCAVCTDFDLCLDCFATTDHAAAIQRLKAAANAHGALQDGNEQTMAPGISAAASNHALSHGYRVADSTRYPLFPSARAVSNQHLENNSNKPTDPEQDPAKESNTTLIDGSKRDEGGDKDKKKEGMEIGKEGSDANVFVIQEDPKAIWTVEEDLRLLDAIATYGLGNWADIADAISGQGSQNKTPKRCMERYFDDFLGRYGQILPPYTIVEDEDKDDEDGEGDDEDGSRKRRRFDRVSSLGAAALTGGRRSKKVKVVPTSSLPGFDKVWADPYLPPIPNVAVGQDVDRDYSTRAELAFVKAISTVTKEEAGKIRKEWSEKRLNKPRGPTVLPMRPEDLPDLPGSELAGFMPRRGDFDLEYENDAEQVLADMEFSANDSQQDRALKIQIIQIYNAKLDERERRKQFLVSRNLLDYRKCQTADVNLPRDERDLLRRLRLFERFHTPEEHKKFVGDTLKAKRLRKEIAKLQMYRRLGIRTLAEAEKYELDKKRREFHKRAQLQKEAEAEKNESTHKVGSKDSGVVSIHDDDVTSSLWKQYRTSDRKNRRSINRGNPGKESAQTPEAAESTKTSGTDTVSTPQSSTASDTKKSDGTIEKSVEKGKQKTDESKPVGTPGTQTKPMPSEPSTTAQGSTPSSSTTTTTTIATAAAPATAVVPGKNNDEFVDKKIQREPGYELLTVKEVQLCERLELKPTEYIRVKKALIHQSLTLGLIDKESAGSSRRSIVKIDVERKGDVVDFMVRAGWISSKQATGQQKMG